jgi:hypothetical protein|tara:strand:+ start:2513 stop:2746 length:234 start_codon:yes stop_codon:yes gene_type:complete
MAVNKKKLVKAVLKKAATKVVRRAGPIGVATTLYDFYKSGQKNSKGKAVKGQKAFLKNAKKSTGKIVKKKKSIYKKK